MQKSRTLLFALLAAATYAQANETIRNANSQFTLSIGGNKLDYEELDIFELTEEGILDSERGTQAAAQVSHSYQGAFAGIERVYHRIEFTFAEGSTNYDGWLQDAETGALVSPYHSRTNARIYEASVRIGKGLAITDAPEWQVTPYLTAGWRKWVRDSADTPYGYREDYEHKYLGAGLLAQRATERTVFGIDVGYAPMVEADMLAPEFGEFRLGTNSIMSLGVSLDISITQRLHLTGSYQLKEFEYGISPVVDDMLEPPSKTREQRLFVGLGIQY